MVELLRRLIQFDTSNPPGNERECLEFAAEVLRQAGIESRLVGRTPSRPNLLARVTGRGAAPPLLLYGHVDVVPAEAAEWSRPPFAGDLSGGEVWGRGALDMKSGVAMMLTAVSRLAAGGDQPAGDLLLVLTCDEERGSELGAKFLVDEHATFFDGVRYAISEVGGFTDWIAGRPFYPIQVAEKQACTIRATIRGRGGHASLPVRDSAAGRLGRLLRALDRDELPVHIVPAVRSMLLTLANALPLPHRLALRPLLIPALTDRVLALFAEERKTLAPLLHNTATPTLIRAGESSNSIPTEATVELDGRVLPGQRPEDLVRELEALAPGIAEYEVVHEEPAPPSAADLALFPMLREILRERHHDGVPFPAVVPGYTDARCFARLGIQTYGFLPLRLPKGFTLELMHAPNERVPADAVWFGADCVYEAIRRYGSGSTVNQ